MTTSANPQQSLLPSVLIQVAFRVENLEAACLEWASKVGAGPFLIRQHMKVQAKHNGQPAIYDHSAAFGQWGTLMLELIEVHECEPAGMKAVMEHDSLGQVNHFACYAEDLEATSAALEAAGFPLAMDLVSSSGMPVRYHDARALIGAVLEVYAPTEHIVEHYANVAALSVGWDGSDVIRYM